jgi:two-component system sensor histidine kinase UhpB
MNSLDPTTELFPGQSGIIPDAHDSAWRDVAVVLAITVASIAVAIHFQLNERLYGITRHWEYFQIDELPFGLLVFSISLIWLAWRRFRQAKRELQARARTETQLVEVLAQNRRLTQEHYRIQEEERKHLARELHDELGQYLNSIKLDATAIEEQLGTDAPLASTAANNILRSVDHLYEVVTGMIARLRPVGLDELGLAAAIEHCVDLWQQRLPKTHFKLYIGGGLDDLDDTLAVTVYRIIQEALTNIYKHAHATQVELQLRAEIGSRLVEQLHLTIQDNGCGLGPVAPASRFGLSGMRERVELAGGRFALHSSSGVGLKVEAYLPKKAKS